MRHRHDWVLVANMLPGTSHDTLGITLRACTGCEQFMQDVYE